MSEKQVKTKAVAKPKKKMIKGETKSGFKYQIEEGTLNDWELFEMITEVETNPILLNKIITMVLGDDQKEKLKEHLRNDEGRIPLDAMNSEIMEIFGSQEQIKKS